MSSFAARLKSLRLKKGESLQVAADAVGISKAHFWDMEAGKSKNPSADLLRAVADHFNVSISALIGEESASQEDEEVVAMFRQYRDLTTQDKELIELIFKQRRKKLNADPD
jgi:transcriptional regulator with XRE-family HTH domain